MKATVIIFVFIILSLGTKSQVFTDDLPGIDSLRVGIGGMPIIADMYNDGDSLLYILGGFRKINDTSIRFVFAYDGENVISLSVNDKDDDIRGGLDCIIKYNDTIYMGGV